MTPSLLRSTDCPRRGGGSVRTNRTLASKQRVLEADCPVVLLSLCNPAEAADAAARNNAVAGDQRWQRVARHCRCRSARSTAATCPRCQFCVGAGLSARDLRSCKPTGAGERTRRRKQRGEQSNIDLAGSSPRAEHAQPISKQSRVVDVSCQCAPPWRLGAPAGAQGAAARVDLKHAAAHPLVPGSHWPANDIAGHRATMHS